jgi:signal transduction histidine kinase
LGGRWDYRLITAAHFLTREDRTRLPQSRPVLLLRLTYINENHKNVETHTPLMARVDQLRRAQDNPVDNACRFGRDTRIRVKNGAANLVEGVQDREPRIPEALHERVFEPFYRIEGLSTR